MNEFRRRRGRLLAVLAFLVVAITAAATVLNGAAASSASPPSGLPGCQRADAPALHREYDDWDRTLVDPGRTLGRAYRPPDLEAVTIHGSVVTVRAFVVEPLTNLLDAAAAAGNPVVVTSAYRSFAEQERLLAENPGSLDSIALPGHSEHQLGTTVDLSGGADWLRANSYRFGFVLSFPAARSPQWTCYRDEPWHFRYFGRERAAEIMRSGLSPREFLWAENADADADGGRR